MSEKGSVLSAASRKSRASSQYEKLSKLGGGSYGNVYKCMNKEKGEIVAIKIFYDNEEDLFIRKVALREIRMLKRLKHPNIVNLIDVFRKNMKFHLVFEYCDQTVLNILEKHPKGCQEIICKQIIWQTIQGTQYCHSHKIIHRDIKPENILMTADGTIKLCDFGFARILTPGVNYTDYVATRWYRAPELLVGDIQYSLPIDIWAIGCVFMELLTGQPVWPGKTDLDQLHLIRATIGSLIPRHMNILTENKAFRGAFLPEVRTIISFETKLHPKYSQNLIILDFIRRCLDKNPHRRWTCNQLLSHDLFANFQLAHVEDNSDEMTRTFLPQLKDSASANSKKSKKIAKKNKLNLPTISDVNFKVSSTSARQQSTKIRHHGYTRYRNM